MMISPIIMSKRISFFATKSDLERALSLMEKRPIRYALTGAFPTPELQVWNTYRELPDLGRADGPQTNLCATYLVADKDLKIAVGRVPQWDGGLMYFVDQQANPETITMTPAGCWGDSLVIAGVLGTASNSKASQSLMRLTAASIKKSFTRVHAYWVGPAALSLLRAGHRLTIAEQSHSEFDLAE